MKPPLIALIVLLAAPLSGFTQGTANFQNRIRGGSGSFIYGPSYNDAWNLAIGDGADYSYRLRLEGSQYTAGLYLEREGLWSQLATSTFRTGIDAGLLIGVSKVTVPNSKRGDVVNLQIRVWDSRLSSWDEALGEARGSGTVIGFSKVIKGYVLGGVDGSGNSISPINLSAAGLESFGLFFFDAPEPSVLAVGALGLLALYHRRRQ